MKIEDEIREECERRYKVFEQVAYCPSWQPPEYIIVDTDNNEIAETGGCHEPWETYESFIEQKVREKLIEKQEDEEDTPKLQGGCNAG